MISALRMPAEWEPHGATWLSWPTRAAAWKDRVPAVRGVWARLIKALAEGEDVHVIAPTDADEADIRATLKEHKADAPCVSIHRFPTNHRWMRDVAPTFVHDRAGAPVIVHWAFNAWGGKYAPWDEDARIPQRIAEATGIERVVPGMVLEGGAIDVNGAGLLMAAEACVLNPNRNGAMVREDVEDRLRAFLGIQRVVWLARGLEGDDTDGHCDNLARFVGDDTIVMPQEKNTQDANHAILRENAERLAGQTTLDRRPLRVIELPMPPPQYHGAGRLPANYSNFYVGNAVVVMPTFANPRTDGLAREILAECFPSREIVCLPGQDVIVGGGNFHCATQQQPAPRA